MVKPNLGSSSVMSKPEVSTNPYPSISRLQAWNGLDLEPEQYGTFPRIASFTDHSTITIEDRVKRPRQTRLLCKDGAYTLISRNIPNLTSRFISDFWNTLLDMSWVIILCFFLFSSLTLWLVFAAFFWAISYFHGDFMPENADNPNWSPCIFFENKTKPFTQAFLFSVETLRTIGYGTPRYPTEECATTVVFLLLGIIVSCLLESVLVGLLLAKTHVPQQRTQTLLFSQHATICTRDKQMCLLFRVANIRTSLLVRLALKAFLVYAKQTDEGEDMPFHQHEINVQIDSNGDLVTLGTPMTACHVIDASSPFYYLSRKNLRKAAFEIIVILEGVVESTGSSIQARTSYVPDEILWGQRFESMYVSEFEGHRRTETFDFSSFNNTESQLGMKDLSAYELEELAELTTPISPAGTPIVMLSMAEDYVDSVQDSEDFQEAVISPSLAKALDIPFQMVRGRGNSRVRRVSVQSRRPSNVARIDSWADIDGLTLPHPCSTRMDSSTGEQRLRRESMSRAVVRRLGSVDAIDVPVKRRKISSPY